MKSVINLILLSSLLLFTNFQCDDFGCDPVQNTATLTIDLSPEKIDYVIGDTILLSTEFGTLLPIPNTNELLNVENGECFLHLLFMRLGLYPDSLTGFSDFEIINFSGNLNQVAVIDTIAKRYEGISHFNCSADICKFQIGLVPQFKGNNCLALHIGSIVLQDTSTCPPHNNLYDNVFTVTSHNREIFQELDIHHPYSSLPCTVLDIGMLLKLTERMHLG